ncbi:hypothetical protein HMPREF0551_2432 [Lautropia mirabilis ATCC 51599]|uniref:Uncharacterized protein n=1 Tax=Lautropia mirabilis ATCC 51599 TaxID=887898 RepID=E7S0G8_9BURK|nr:hypothetical protein HMPREF0551_2432 [Lautropia mirabilis ATCC 51599]
MGEVLVDKDQWILAAVSPQQQPCDMAARGGGGTISARPPF